MGSFFCLLVIDETFIFILRNLLCPEKFLDARLKWKLSVPFPLHNFYWQIIKKKFLACRNQYTYSRASIWLVEMRLKGQAAQNQILSNFLKIKSSLTLATTSRLSYNFLWNMPKPICCFVSCPWFWACTVNIRGDIKRIFDRYFF